MKTFILLGASQGYVKAIFVAHGETIAALCTCVGDRLQANIDAFTLPWSAGNQGFMAEQRTALLAMLAAQDTQVPGCFILANVDPIWEEWILVVSEPPHALSYQH